MWYAWGVLLQRIRRDKDKGILEQFSFLWLGGLPAVPAVVLEHVEGGVGEEGSASHFLVAQLFLRVTQLLHYTLTVPQQLIQPQFPAHHNTEILTQVSLNMVQ